MDYLASLYDVLFILKDKANNSYIEQIDYTNIVVGEGDPKLGNHRYRILCDILGLLIKNQILLPCKEQENIYYPNPDISTLLSFMVAEVNKLDSNFNFFLKEAEIKAAARGVDLQLIYNCISDIQYLDIQICKGDEILYTIKNKPKYFNNNGVLALNCVLFALEDLPLATQEKTTFIYGLFDPRNPKKVKYVGKSDNPAIRHRQHISSSKDGFLKKDEWIQDLLSMNPPIEPQVKILHQITYKYEFEWSHWEKLYIKQYQKHVLTNMALGGTSYENKGFNEYEERLDAWRKDPTPENEAILKKLQRKKIGLRDGKICKYCGAFIPKASPDGWDHWNKVYFDILPFKPLVDNPDIWPTESKKHDRNCVWWKTGIIGKFPPIDQDTLPELRILQEEKIKKYESFLYFSKE